VSMGVGCPNGHPSRPGARFCPQCGQPYVSTARGVEGIDPEGSRKRRIVLPAVVSLLTFAVVAAAVALIVMHNNDTSPVVATGGDATTASATTAIPVTSATTNPASPTSLLPATTTAVPADYNAVTYQGSSFSIQYPTGWVVSHIPEGGNLDSTFQPAAAWTGWLIRVDEDPDSGGTLDAASDPVIEALQRDPTYALVSLTRFSFVGVPALRWEFEDTEENVRLHKVDIFFIDAYGNGWGVLVQAPQSAWPQEREALETFQASFSDLATS
jgi:hypothetical protein